MLTYIRPVCQIDHSNTMPSSSSSLPPDQLKESLVAPEVYGGEKLEVIGGTRLRPCFARSRVQVTRGRHPLHKSYEYTGG